MKKFFSVFFTVLGVIAAMAVATCAIVALIIHFTGAKPTSKINVTNVEVKNDLVTISELATYSMEYEGYREVDCAKEVFKHDIPGTKYTIRIAYTGCIKVGYDFSEIDVSVDNDKQIIKIKLPKMIVISSGINNDEIKINDSDVSFINNVLNPVSPDLVTKELATAEKDEYDKAINEKNIEDLAKENAKTEITNTLTAFADEGFEIIFTD